MSLRRNGQEFLDLVDMVERYSRIGCNSDSFPEGESLSPERESL
jgi:hypothetical protein